MFLYSMSTPRMTRSRVQEAVREEIAQLRHLGYNSRGIVHHFAALQEDARGPVRHALNRMRAAGELPQNAVAEFDRQVRLDAMREARRRARARRLTTAIAAVNRIIQPRENATRNSNRNNNRNSRQYRTNGLSRQYSMMSDNGWQSPANNNFYHTRNARNSAVKHLTLDVVPYGASMPAIDRQNQISLDKVPAEHQVYLADDLNSEGKPHRVYALASLIGLLNQKNPMTRKRFTASNIKRVRAT